MRRLRYFGFYGPAFSIVIDRAHNNASCDCAECMVSGGTTRAIDRFSFRGHVVEAGATEATPTNAHAGSMRW